MPGALLRPKFHQVDPCGFGLIAKLMQRTGLGPGDGGAVGAAVELPLGGKLIVDPVYLLHQLPRAVIDPDSQPPIPLRGLVVVQRHFAPRQPSTPSLRESTGHNGANGASSQADHQVRGHVASVMAATDARRNKTLLRRRGWATVGSEHKGLLCRPFLFFSGGGIRTRDLRVMSPNLASHWTTWGTVSSGFREIEIGWNRLESVELLAPFPAQRPASIT
jgi:hypothetical protein